MSELKKYQIDDLPFYCWKYEEQTEVKHKVLIEYIDKWIKILGLYKTLNYIDGYGGCGAYTKDGKEVFYGSPIEVAKVIDKNSKKLGRNVNLIVIEKDKEVAENFKKAFEYSNVETKLYLKIGDFDTEINIILDKLESKGKSVNPTFFFIDPFGYQINMKTIERIMVIPKSEIFINFMFNAISRFLDTESEIEKLNKLFDNESKWKEGCKLTKGKREKFIIEIYKDRLRKFSSYVVDYKINFPQIDRTYFYLIHLSNHSKGSSIMKSSFARYNEGRTEYLGKNSNNLSIFDMPKIKFGEIKECFYKSNFIGKSISFNDIIEIISCKKKFLDKDIRSTLKNMELENEIKVERIDSKRNGLGGNDIVTFLEINEKNN